MSHPYAQGPAGAPDWTTEYDEPPPVVGESVFRIPGVSMREWFRLAALEHHRGRLTHREFECLKHAQLVADPKSGRLIDVPHWMATYQAAAGFGQTMAYRVRRGLVLKGWLRKAQGTSYGVTAVYELQLPVRLLPQGCLPDDLQQAVLHDPEPDHADSTYGHLTSRPSLVTVPEPAAPAPPLAVVEAVDEQEPTHDRDDEEIDPHRIYADPEVDWIGSLTAGLEEVELCPYTARASYPLGLSSDVDRGVDPTKRTKTRGGGRRRPLTTREQAAAAAVLAACRVAWLDQRGPGGGLTADQLATLVPVVAKALRRTTPGDVIERLSSQVRSARSLPHVLGARLWQLIRSRPEYGDESPPEVPVDEAGERRAAFVDERARAHSASLASPMRQAAVGFARAAIAAARAAVPSPEPDPQPAPFVHEAPAVLAAERAWEDVMREPVQAYRALATRPGGRTGHDRIRRKPLT